MKNVFFIQRAAIDVLLLNDATAIEICTYLVISKYTDCHGYESGVGYKTIKERLGIGQRKVSEAIRRLKSMEFAGQRLLHTKDGWLFNETGSLPNGQENVGWVRGWFESEYYHNVWLYNDLVGDNGDKDRTLNFFVKVSERDNHARLLLLLFKYHNRQYSGVNFKFASIISAKVKEKEKEASYKINGFEFHKSSLGKYHISQKVLNKFDLSMTSQETRNILDDLRMNDFINVSISVIGKHDGPIIPAKVVTKRILYKKTSDRIYSTKQLASWERIKEIKKKFKDHRITFALAKIPVNKGSSTFTIGLKRIYTKTTLNEFSNHSLEELKELPGDFSESYSQFIYRLDYKSNKKRTLKLEDCLAGNVEEIIQKCGLESASRKGKFYDTYWWFNPGIDVIRLVGIMMPIHIPSTKLFACNETAAALDKLNSADTNMVDIIVNNNISSNLGHDF